MNGVAGHDSTNKGYTGPGPHWADNMNFGKKHVVC